MQTLHGPLTSGEGSAALAREEMSTCCADGTACRGGTGGTGAQEAQGAQGAHGSTWGTGAQGAHGSTGGMGAQGARGHRGHGGHTGAQGSCPAPSSPLTSPLRRGGNSSVRLAVMRDNQSAAGACHALQTPWPRQPWRRTPGRGLRTPAGAEGTGWLGVRPPGDLFCPQTPGSRTLVWWTGDQG